MDGPRPDIDPEDIAKDAPPPCDRWPTCDDVLGEQTCTWPGCMDGDERDN